MSIPNSTFHHGPLGPIRDYVVKRLPAPRDRCDVLVRIVTGIAQTTCAEIGSNEGMTAVTRLSPILRNVEVAIPSTLDELSTSSTPASVSRLDIRGVTRSGSDALIPPRGFFAP